MKRVLIPLALALLLPGCAQDTPAAPSDLEPQMARGGGGRPHSYVLVEQTSGVIWQTAYTSAPTLRYRGRENGYLATITSAAENETIRALIVKNNHSACWIGLWQPEVESAQYTYWEWVDGTTLDYAAGIYSPYANWAAGEPSNLWSYGTSGFNESRADMSSDGTWADQYGTSNTRRLCYIVEFGN